MSSSRTARKVRDFTRPLTRSMTRGFFSSLAASTGGAVSNAGLTTPGGTPITTPGGTRITTPGGN